jgi:asparagine N-glycosylation enzyme membrane subunit Stt3
MSGKKTISIALLVVGVILLIGSLTADSMGIGGSPGFGYKQIIGAVAGVIGIIAGFVSRSKSKEPAK